MEVRYQLRHSPGRDQWTVPHCWDPSG
ncbi:MAG: hypothetical protein QG597_2093, partial [Actinomycetota bacterium]|nr:hypothetical protein [Actinomycetota bacterium]